MKEEILRKLFHTLALLYVAGAVFLSRPLFLGCLLILLLVDAFIETLRMKNPNFAAFFQKHFGRLIRAEEQHRWTGVFWMILGFFSAAFLIGPLRVLVTIYMFTIFGDAAASLVGKGVGGFKWPGSPKSLSGSLAFFLICLGLCTFLLRPIYAWPGLIACSLVATVLEFGILSLNDNLTIPLGTSLIFLAIYRLPLGV